MHAISSYSNNHAWSYSHGKLYSAGWQDENIGRIRSREMYSFIEYDGDMLESIYWWSTSNGMYRCGSPGRAMSIIKTAVERFHGRVNLGRRRAR